MCEREERRCDHDAGRPRDGDLGVRVGAETYTGSVIVRLAPEVDATRGEDLATAAEEAKLPGLVRVLDALGRPDTRRLISSLSPGEVLEMEDAASRGPLPPLHSLTSYWRIDAREVDRDPDDVVRLLQQLPEVDLAYRELSGGDPTVTPGDDTWNANQGYLDAAPTGIDARWAWLQPNGEGAGVGVVDLEQGWIPTHEDLTAKTPTLVFGTNRHLVGTYVGNHGTAVLGEMVGVDNTRGVVGIAPACTSVRMTSHFDGVTVLNVANAIVAVLPSMAVGDVLLLEVQRAGGTPTEVDAADLDAIRLAVSRGVTVVEAAGNGNVDLDAWTDPMGNQRLNRGSAQFQDSGAIMCGAAESALPHDRAGFSSFGSRVDCYGWGENVTTCGYGDLAGTGHDDRYTDGFNGTSSASPIVAGAAMVLQSMYRGVAGTSLSPLQMRSRLSNPATGTAQGGGVAGNIGVMPNLRAIAETALNLVPDVYLRDFVGDTGVVPSAGSISSSPDVICVPAPVAHPTASFGEGSGTENDATVGSTVEAGQDNTIYVRMRNRGGAAATGVTVRVWWSPPSTLVTPPSWSFIGTTAPVNVPTGNTLVVAGPVTWPAAAVPASGTHACFVAIANAPGDGAPPLPGAFDWAGFVAMIRNQNNVVWKNFNVVDNDPADPAALDVIVAGAPDEARAFDLEIVQQLPEGVRAAWLVPPALYALLPQELRREADETKEGYVVPLPALRAFRLCDVRLPREAAFPTRLLLTPGRERALARGTHTVAIRQVWEGVEVGRVTWALRPAKRRTPRKGKER